MNEKRFLITGLNGIIGWNLFSRISREHVVTGTYRKEHPGLKGLAVYRLDWDEEEISAAFFQKADPEYLIHAWAMCDLDLCEQMPDMAEEINLRSTRKILAAARGIKHLKKIIYISTDHVFNGDKGKYSEEDVPNPKHVYGATKFAAEKEIQASGFPYLIIRPGLVIGESLQGNKGPRDFLFTRIRKEKPTHYFTDEWRTPVKGEDLAEQVMQLSLSDRLGIFHIAGNESYSRYELACLLASAGGLSSHQIFPRLRKEDRWAHIRPHNLSLVSRYLSPSASIFS